MSRRRDVALATAAAIAYAILLTVVVILFRGSIVLQGQAVALRAELADARAQIDELGRGDEPAEGGAETDAPQTPDSGSGWTWPIAESDYLALTSPFGFRVSPILGYERYHQGLDIAATWRAQVVSAADGIVVEHWPPPGTPGSRGGTFVGHEVYGGLVIVEHSDGWRTLYAHLSETRIRTGQRVSAGEVLGRVGSTGQARGAHLHFEIMDAAGERRNPLLYTRPREAAL